MVFNRPPKPLICRTPRQAVEINCIPSEAVLLSEDSSGRLFEGPNGRYRHCFACEGRREQFERELPESVVARAMGAMPKRSSLAVRYGFQR
jgi:hypothetical protein